ncbi:hypothetical protein BDV41DRAFT_533246 [Aspergillus transmontanensis]|uniref:Uncharacterized protein n=1 Tax=Aspergillus transmontanensis TaxID=1034304 RepID=A0A5N6W266_9EURO|nr:hypothetical protein BDV41DRAFT_533246 [Aspergillus transmontanensis]
MSIDGFGLYRNMYRSLMGFYIIPVCLTAAERTNRGHSFQTRQISRKQLNSHLFQA